MIIIRKILIGLLFLVIVQETFGTAQIPDFMIYKGDTLKIFSNPLESYFNNHPSPDSIFEKYGYHSTASWRKYIAYWELRNDSLFLLEIKGGSSNIDLSLIFKDRETDRKIFADWFDYSILNPHGKQIRYEHSGYNSIYEFEREFVFSNGILIDIIEFDNTNSIISEFYKNPELLKSFFQENIDYSKLENESCAEVRVFVQIVNVTEEGKIDSVKVLRGFDKEHDMEALRVVKLIPEWNVLFSRGEKLNYMWVVPVIFNRKEE
jgi:hypothetical protein